VAKELTQIGQEAEGKGRVPRGKTQDLQRSKGEGKDDDSKLIPDLTRHSKLHQSQDTTLRLGAARTHARMNEQTKTIAKPA
jgi:hypothetical protein